MTKQKSCIVCKTIIQKPVWQSYERWENGYKYCSRKCQGVAQSGKGNPFYGRKHSSESIRKIKKTRQRTVEIRGREIYKKIAEANTGEKSHKWKGELVGVRAIHLWVERKKGKAREHSCEDCGEQARHWSNIDHNYRRDVRDYRALCVKCHVHYDRTYLK